MLVVAAVLALPWSGLPVATVRTFGVTFVSIVLEALPFVLLGAVLGGLVEAFVPRDRIAALLPRRTTPGILLAAALGLTLPACECAIIPLARRLVGKGVPFSVALAYLLGGPIVNPLVAASTYVAFGGDWLIVAARLICGYSVAACVALIFAEVYPGTAALLPAAAGDADEHACGCGQGDTCAPDGTEHSDHAAEPQNAAGRGARWLAAARCASDDFLDITQYLVLGAIAAALAQTFIARTLFLSLAETPAAAIGGMQAFAVALNLCSEADAFVAGTFYGVLPTAALLAFMVLGPMLDLKLVAMYLSFVKRGAVTLLAGLLIAVVFALSFALHLAGVLPP